MPYTDNERSRIAEAVRKARITAELDKEPAARAAKVNSITWKRVEDAESVRDASLAKILRSLDMPNADDILGGGEVRPAAARVVLLSEVPTDDLFDELRRRIPDKSLDQGQDRPDFLGTGVGAKDPRVNRAQDREQGEHLRRKQI